MSYIAYPTLYGVSILKWAYVLSGCFICLIARVCVYTDTQGAPKWFNKTRATSKKVELKHII